MNLRYFGGGDDHADSEDDDDDVEMVGLLADTDHDVTPGPMIPGPMIPTPSHKQKSILKTKETRRKRGIKPLEVMHSTSKRRLAKSPAAVAACRTGFGMLLLAVAIGLWLWSGRQVDMTTSIQRWHSLKLRDIRHWCLDKSSDCKCPNPLDAQDRIGHKTWQQAHDGNVREALTAREVDVVLLGDSITEGWRGMSFGQPVPAKKPNIKVFESLFHERKGADFQGLALGIAGDRTNNLLWRMQNGEIPSDLHPSVWWILIGTNDFGRDLPHCSPEVVLMGITRVVEEMRKLRPGSTIVVNALLPRSEDDLDGWLVDSKHGSRVTVWQGIMEVNRRLRQYCANVRNVVYFDATSIFVRQANGTKGLDGMYIPKELMYDYLHPTAEGYKIWGDQIISTVHNVMEASSSEKGRLPLPAKWWERTKKSKTALPHAKVEANTTRHD